jgi:D-3-phosphoglycerate dehydrogenase / 2-oxoglutarate reductase
MAKIFLTHTPDMLVNYYGERPLTELRKLGEVRLNETGRVLDADALAKEAGGCDIVISDRQTPGAAEFFRQAADCVAFLRVAIDIRNIDVPAASREGILVTQATAGFIPAVAEMAIGMMVDLGRHISRSTAEYRAGNDSEPRMGKQLEGATLGILGYGQIGEYLARLGIALGMRVLVNDPFKTVNETGVTQASFEDVLAQSDFVVCLVVATERTENLMNAAAFAQMKRGAFFVNLSRGNLVDEKALEAALNAKQIAGAAMDVGRAPDQKPPLFLAKRPDVIATPHTAGLTPEAAEHQAFDTVNQARSLLAGDLPPGAVNADAAHRLKRLAKR